MLIQITQIPAKASCLLAISKKDQNGQAGVLTPQIPDTNLKAILTLQI